MSPKPAPAGGAAVDALLVPSFLENATTQPMSEVRRLRREAEQQEVNLSYTRRLLQGRLDIVRRELQRRAEHDGRSLVDLLPEILSEKGRGPAHGLGRHQTVQPHNPEEYESWVNGLTGSIDMSDISDLSDAKLEKAARALAAAESGLSERRRLHRLVRRPRQDRPVDRTGGEGHRTLGVEHDQRTAVRRLEEPGAPDLDEDRVVGPVVQRPSSASRAATSASPSR